MNLNTELLTPSIQVVHDKAKPLLDRLYNHDRQTYYHSINVAICTYQICSHMQMQSEIFEEVLVGALLHDIGKLNCPLSILQKKASLTNAEYETIKKHTLQGLEYVSNYSHVVKDIVLYHHERIDGSGYPFGLDKDNLPWWVQVVMIADTYAAITEERAYKKPKSQVIAISELENSAYNEQYVSMLTEIALPLQDIEY